MVGAAGSAYMINDAATILPRAVVVKARAYLAGAAADVLEVGNHIFNLIHGLKCLRPSLNSCSQIDWCEN